MQTSYGYRSDWLEGVLVAGLWRVNGGGVGLGLISSKQQDAEPPVNNLWCLHPHFQASSCPRHLNHHHECLVHPCHQAVSQRDILNRLLDPGSQDGLLRSKDDFVRKGGLDEGRSPVQSQRHFEL